MSGQLMFGRGFYTGSIPPERAQKICNVSSALIIQSGRRQADDKHEQENLDTSNI